MSANMSTVFCNDDGMVTASEDAGDAVVVQTPPKRKKREQLTAAAPDQQVFQIWQMVVRTNLEKIRKENRT
jgi:hypothetical protein